MAQMTIEDYGAVPNNAGVDNAPFINAGLADLMTRETGGTLLIPEERYYCTTRILPPRGDNATSIGLHGISRQSVIDIRNSPFTQGIVYDGAGTDGPTKMSFKNFRIRGSGSGLGQSGMVLDFQSGSLIENIQFEFLTNGITMEESFAVTMRDCLFNQISHNCVKFNTNAHNFRMMNCSANAVSQTGGAVINFAATDGTETHTVLIEGNNFEQIGTLIRVSSTSGGITGLVGNGNYTEGFEPGIDIFDFPEINGEPSVRGFYWTGCSFSKGTQTAPAEPVVIKNINGGRIEGVRLFQMTLDVQSSSTYWDRLQNL